MSSGVPWPAPSIQNVQALARAGSFNSPYACLAMHPSQALALPGVQRCRSLTGGCSQPNAEAYKAPSTNAWETLGLPSAPTSPVQRDHRRPGAPPPDVPKSMAENFPPPESVALQKGNHERALDEQLQKQLALLTQKHKANLEFLRARNDQQKRHTNAAIDRQMLQNKVELQSKLSEQVLLLSQAANQKKAELDNQALMITMEYNIRKVQDDLLAQDYEVHRRYVEASTMSPTSKMSRSFEAQREQSQQV